MRSDQLLAYRSTLRYPELEAESGVHIFSEVGYGVVGVERPGSSERPGCSLSTELRQGDEFCEEHGMENEVLSEEEVRERWGYFVPPAGCVGRFVPQKSGYLSIRNLVGAAQKVAVRNGVERVEQVVRKVEYEEAEGVFCVVLSGGESLKTKKVILASGSFTNFFDFPFKLDLRLIGHSVMKFEISDEDYELTKDFPTMNYRYDPSNSDVYLYILPPIIYPNGKKF